MPTLENPRAERDLGDGWVHWTLVWGQSQSWPALTSFQLDLQNRARKMSRVTYAPSHWSFWELFAVGNTIPLHNKETKAPGCKQISSQSSVGLGAGFTSACVQDNFVHDANFKMGAWEPCDLRGICWTRAVASPGITVRGIWGTSLDS